MQKIIFHIDVNNAFLSWTAVDMLRHGHKKDIRKLVAVIGGEAHTRSGVVLAKSILAKEKDIQTGEPIAFSMRKYPKVEVYPPNFELYKEQSQKLFNLISNYTPDIEIFSIDECFLDYTKVQKLYGDPLVFAAKLAREIEETLGFTVNIGIGNNKLCAKMASDFSKPNKIHTLFDEEIETKLWPLPVGKLLWIGKKSSAILEDLGIKTIYDLAHADVNYLAKYFKNQTPKMIENAWGKDNSLVISEERAAKGISTSVTFERDLIRKEDIYQTIESQCISLSLSLRSQKKYATVISVFTKNQFFKTTSHQMKLANATDLTEEIILSAKKLFDDMWNKEPIRLVGVRLDKLVSSVNYQISLFDSLEKRESSTTLDDTVDSLKNKYGTSIITIASTVKKKK